MIFLTGGARSGKSSAAASLARRTGSPVRLVVTARSDDEEMDMRIEEHRRHRPHHWTVVEAPIEVELAVGTAAPDETVVLDCLTLWVSNLMVERDDRTILEMVNSVVVSLSGRAGESIVVSNEVGSGLVPMNPVGRRFRDLQGRANQVIAAAAEASYLVIAGKMLRLADADDVF